MKSLNVICFFEFTSCGFPSTSIKTSG
jgi:hypothetical protein